MGDAGSKRDPGWWSEATPIWVTLQRKGIPTAELSWPGGYVEIDGVKPDFRLSGTAAGTPENETNLLAGWLALPPDERLRFVMIHYEKIDAIGHRNGPESGEMNAGLREIDQAIRQLVTDLKHEGLYATTDLIIVSDHGMAALSPDRRIYLDDLVDTKSVDIVSLGAGIALNPKKSSAGEAAVRTLLQDHPDLKCQRKQDLPARLHYGSNPRVPEIICLATPGWLVTTHGVEIRRKSELAGEHGYDNLDPSMRAIFIAEGPSFRRGYVAPAFPNVDVYPLIAHIFGVQPEPNDGDLFRVMPLLKEVKPASAVTGSSIH